MQYLNYKKKLNKFGTILIPKEDTFIDKDDFKKIEKNLKKIPTEFVKIGDAGEKNHVFVSRLMTDIKKPLVVNRRYSNKVLKILNDKYLSIFKKIVDKKKLFIRRAQVNNMKKNAFVGYHLDVDSNPDYLYAVVIQLGSRFTGGKYVVYKNKKKKNFQPKIYVNNK